MGSLIIVEQPHSAEIHDKTTHSRQTGCETSRHTTLLCEATTSHAAETVVLIVDSSHCRCLQFNALPGSLTGREVLHLYARLRGVPSSHIRATVEDLVRRIDLSEYADRSCSAQLFTHATIFLA